MIKSDAQGNWVVPDSTATPPMEYLVEVFSQTNPALDNKRHDHLCKRGHGGTSFAALSPM